MLDSSRAELSVWLAGLAGLRGSCFAPKPHHTTVQYAAVVCFEHSQPRIMRVVSQTAITRTVGTVLLVVRGTRTVLQYCTVHGLGDIFLLAPLPLPLPLSLFFIAA